MATTATLNINVNAGQASKTVDQLNKDVQKAGGSAASLKAELRQITQELQGLSPGSARFAELSQRAGQLRDTIADTSAVIASTAGNAVENFGRALGNTIQIGVAGFQSLMAIQTLFGSENEDLNKSLARFSALLNLSQAIETFGGLGDKLTEIRAGFGLLTTATNTQTVAMEGEAIATTEAAVATTGLGLAMKALPFVAIIAGLASLAYGLISYASASEEADKEEKKRKANLEALKKSEKEQAEFVKKESSEFTTLIYQLKATNAGTERRSQLIKQINSAYGTTLKNLSDENLFQEQLNNSVKDYITLQYNRFKLEKNQDYIDSQNEKRFNAELKRNKILANAQDLVNKGIRKSVEDALSYLQFDREALAQAEKDIKDADDALLKLGLRREQLTKVEDDLTLSGKRYVEQTKESIKATDDNSEATKNYNDILSDIKSIQDQAVESENNLYKQRVEFGDKTIDLVERDRKIRLDNLKKTYEATKTNITKTITEENKRIELLKNLEDAYTAVLKNEGEIRIGIDKHTAEERLKKEKETIDLLILENDALQKEIRFGDGDTTDTLLGLQNERLQNEINNIDTRLKYEELSQGQYETLLQEKLALTLKYLENERIDAEAIAAAEYARQIKLTEQRLITERGLKFEATVDAETQRTKYLIYSENEAISKIANLEPEARQAAMDEYLKGKTEDEKKAAQNQYDIIIGTQKAIEKTSLNLEEEYLTKKENANTEYLNDYKDATEKTEEDINEKRLKNLSDYLAAFQNVFGMFEDTFTMYLEQQNEKRTIAIDDAYNQQLASLESSLAEGLISREEYDNKITLLDQQQAQKKLALDRENFRKTKALNIVNATMDGAQAVLSTFAGTPGGIIIKGIAAALAAVFAATQIALISRQQFTAAGGGIVPGDGSGQIDSVSSMLAPGEAVINSTSTNAFLPLLSAINEIGGGRSLMPNLPAVNAGQRFQPVFVNQNQPQLIRAYVVESDISASQKRVNRIERSTTF